MEKKINEKYEGDIIIKRCRIIECLILDIIAIIVIIFIYLINMNNKNINNIMYIIVILYFFISILFCY